MSMSIAMSVAMSFAMSIFLLCTDAQLRNNVRQPVVAVMIGSFLVIIPTPMPCEEAV